MAKLCMIKMINFYTEHTCNKGDAQIYSADPIQIQSTKILPCRRCCPLTVSELASNIKPRYKNLLQLQLANTILKAAAQFHMAPQIISLMAHVTLSGGATELFPYRASSAPPNSIAI